MLGDTSRRALALLTVGMLLAAASPAAAGPPAPSSAPPPPSTSAPKLIFDAPPSTPAVPQWKLNQQREILFREGQKLIQQSLWKEALEKFRAANEIRSDPKMLLWIGFPQEQLGQLLAARTLYTQAKEDAQKQKLKQEEQDADAALTALAQKIPHLIIHLPKGPEAAIYLDSARITLEGERVDVDPGKHKLSVVWPDRSAYPFDVEIKVGETQTINVPLPQPPPPPPPPDPVAPVPPKQGGCGCRVGGAFEPLGGLAAFAALGLGAALAARRRRRE